MLQAIDRAEILVRDRIKGYRKGSTVPCYHHSIRVSKLLKEEGASEDIVVAGMLHDIIEDSETTLKELRQEFSKETVSLVMACTHDKEIPDRDARWLLMISNIVQLQITDPVRGSWAWSVKVADLIDNVRSSKGLTPGRRHFMLNVKAPLVIELTKSVRGVENLRRKLIREVKNQKGFGLC